MDSGWAAFFGAIAGALASLGGIVLRDCLREYQRKKAENPKKRLLKTMLEGGHNWRNLSVLANVTGLTESDAKRLLVEIGARGSEINPCLWGLVSRNPLPTHDPD